MIIVQEAGTGQRWQFAQPFIIGREPGARSLAGKKPDIMPDDHFVSVWHCLVSKIHGEWWAEDLGSTNGTYLNESEQRLRHLTLLRRGDRIRVGRTEYIMVPVETAACVTAEVGPARLEIVAGAVSGRS
jgi:pSer/pThr/pTyr-binding forkhead associated (FHA) protein